jgi:hypothetical protein
MKEPAFSHEDQPRQTQAIPEIDILWITELRNSSP